MDLGAWYPPVFALLAWGVAVIGPVLIIRRAADYIADKRRRPRKPGEGGTLVVVEDNERMSPVVVPLSLPTPPKPPSTKIFSLLRVATISAGVVGFLSILNTPASRLGFYGILIGFLGTLFVTAFEERYLNRFRAPPP